MASTEDELETLFRRTHAPLVRALAVACGDAEAAADAVQEAFVQADRHWRRIRHYRAPEAWVRRVAVNRLANLSRTERRHEARAAKLASERLAFAVPPASAAVLDLR